MEFRYQVLDKSKNLLQGMIEADSVKQARLSLLQQGYDVLLLESVRERYQKMRIGDVGVVPLKEKMLFVKHLSLMIKSGMLLDESLEALYDSATGRMKAILHRLIELVKKGSLLSDGLSLFPYTFNEFFVNMIRVGEKSGSFEKNLVNLAVKLKKDHDLTSKVRSAMMYPAIVLFALAGMGITLAVVILPKLLVFFKSLHVDIPFATRVFIWAADLFERYWYGALLGFAGLIVLTAFLNKISRTKIVIHWAVLHLPIMRSFSKISNLANFCRSMNLMLEGGMTIDESLEIMTRATNNALYHQRIGYALTEVRRGIPLSEALSRYPAFFPAIVTRMLKVGEVSGSLSETFAYLAEFFEDELDALSKNLSTILEPALLIVIGLLVGFIAMAIISPIYQLTGGIRR
ncbi:MAG: type II secretion system F family protein [Candidatus Komeilibacteria bacterium]|nr:type II secretion system F family protein [Candidatus Komeilibacteria bacterium]